MLLWMKLKNLALVESAEVEFGRGCHAITGETGAGKSVIMGAVLLLLGARAEKSAIRTGEQKCELSAEFSLEFEASGPLQEFLAENAVDTASGRIIIRRIITATASRNFVNDSPVTLQTLRRIGDSLIDLHAANENQSILDPLEQLRILDRFAKLDSELKSSADAWRTVGAVRSEIETFAAGMPSPEEASRFRRDLREIDDAAPEQNEDDELKAKHLRASNSLQLATAATQGANALAEQEDCVLERLVAVRRVLREIERADTDSATSFLDRLESLCDASRELGADLSRYASSIELDEAEFQALESRIGILQTLKRRYGPTLGEVLAHAEKLRDALVRFDNAQLRREELQQKEIGALARFDSAAAELSEARKRAAKKIVALLNDETRKLGFLQAEFEIRFSSCDPGPRGTDRIEILFSANVGEPRKPLREVASSGEISRIMLAVKTVLAEADSIPVLVFDEIDANIGGETAVRVGLEIAKLGKSKQILCISHLPQVACHADHHYQVTKHAEDGRTTSKIKKLSPSERIRELARMLGGGAAATVHAKELLAGRKSS